MSHVSLALAFLLVPGDFLTFMQHQTFQAYSSFWTRLCRPSEGDDLTREIFTSSSAELMALFASEREQLSSNHLS